MIRHVIYPFLVLLFFSCNSSRSGYVLLSDGSKESCVACHTKVQGFSVYHNPDEIGCSACHLGNKTAIDKIAAHQNLIKIPGNLQDANRTCATSQCHANELNRIEHSLMSTNSGIVSIDKWAFSEIHTTDTLLHIERIANTSAETHLKNFCYKCHLGYEKKHYSATDELSRGGGCLACHLNYDIAKQPNINDNLHPNLSIKIGNDTCFGCHSRSSRIATNYEGWYETNLVKSELTDLSKYRILQDGRVFAPASDDVHHQAGLLCVDCHLSQEVMGDGKTYKHQQEALKIQCKDCHTPISYKTKSIQELTTIEAKDFALHNFKHKTTEFLSTEKDDLAIINSFLNKKGDAYLIGKKDNKMHIIPRSCEADKAHRNLDCNMCHTSWAPSCIGCHTTYDANILLRNGKKGKWQELSADFSSEQPIMAVDNASGINRIVPAIPGMIMSLDKSAFVAHKTGKDSLFLRLFAPIKAHTTQKKVRSCKSCHLNPHALGYGKGKLVLNIDNNKAVWQLKSLYENNANDNLPQDAWIGFLDIIEGSKKYSAHEFFTPLDLKTQKAVLQVGACLYCHMNDKAFEKKLIEEDYSEMLKNRSDKCIIP